MAQTESMTVYSDAYEKAKQFNNLDHAIDFLDNRVKSTYRLEGLIGLEIIPNGIKMILLVKEADNNLFLTGTNSYEKEFFIPKYVWNHLTSFLNVPSRVFEYYQSFRNLISEQDFKKCQDNESEILGIMFNNRLEEKRIKEEAGKKAKKDLYITSFKDGFGEFPRIIHSDLYYPYEDSEALEMIINGFNSVNAKHDNREYEFKNAFISPYRSEFSFSNLQTKTPVKVGEEIESGITLINSECKNNSLTFQALVIRLMCLNGVISEFPDNTLKIRHYENAFENKIKNGFVKVLQLENKFAKQYMEASEKDKKISNDWADFLEVPNSILAMQNSGKQELIDIAKQQDYAFTPYGVIQALTYKGSHRTHDDNTKKLINKKTVNILDNIDLLQKWSPREASVSQN